MSTTTVLVFDIEGRTDDVPPRRRSEVIGQVVATKRVPLGTFCEDPNTNTDHALILVHLSDMNVGMPDALEDAAKNGAVAIVYSNGAVQRKVEAMERGVHARLTWYEVLELLHNLPTDFTLDDVRQALVGRTDRHLVQALMTVSWSVALATREKEPAAAASAWLQPERWRELFIGITQSQLQAACGIIAGSVDNGELAEVEKAIAWIDLDKANASTCDAPAFDLVLAQLSERFKLEI